MPGPALEDGELEDGEVHEDRPAEMEESGEASGCEGVAGEDEHGSSAADHQQHDQQQPPRAPSAQLPTQPSPLPPPPSLQSLPISPVPMRCNRSTEAAPTLNGSANGGGGQGQSKGRSRSSAHDLNAGAGRSRQKTAEGHTAPQPYQPGVQTLSLQILQQQQATAAAASASAAAASVLGAAAAAAGGRDPREDREAEELVGLLRDLTRGSTFQDVMRSLETVCRDLKQAIKKLDKLFRRVKKRKGDSIEDYPDCFQFSRRVLEGLHTVNKFSQTSAFQAAPPSGADAARALFKAAMNYRHDIFNPALKLELEGLVRNSKAFKCVLENRRNPTSQQGPGTGGSGSGAAGAAGGAAPAPEAAVGALELAATAPAGAAGEDPVLAGSAAGGCHGGATVEDAQRPPPLPPPPGDEGASDSKDMEVDDGPAAVLPPPPRSSRSVSAGPDHDTCVVPAPPPPGDWQQQQQAAAVGLGPGSAGGGGRSVARTASSVAGSGGGISGGYKLKIVVASTAGDLRAAAAAAGGPAEDTSGEADGDVGAGRPGIGGRMQSPHQVLAGDEPAAKRSRTSASVEPDAGGRGSSVGAPADAAATSDQLAPEAKGQPAAAQPHHHVDVARPLPTTLLRWSTERGDLSTLPPPPESPVSDAGGEGDGEAWEQHGQQAGPVPPQPLPQPLLKQEPPEWGPGTGVASGSGTGATGSGGAAAAASTRVSAGEHEAGSAPGGQGQGHGHTGGGSHSDRERERDPERERRARDKDGKEKDRERERERERDRDKEKDRERDRERERHRSSKEKERDKERDNGGGSSHRSSRHRDRDRDAPSHHPPLPPPLADPHAKPELPDGSGSLGAPAAAGPGSCGAARVSDEVAACLSRSRLVLVVDLDGVLADSCWDAQLDGPTAAALARRAAVEGAALTEERRELFRLPLDGGALWLKLRPGARAFLARATERFELWARTRQGRPYADAVVELLDPSQQLFGSRVVAQGVLARRLLAALDVRAPIAALLDTPDAGWMGEQLTGNLLALPPYSYFAYRPCASGGGVAALAGSGMTGRPLLEVDRDECPERGVLAAALQLLEALHGRLLHVYGSGAVATANPSAALAGGGAAAAAAGPAGGHQATWEAWDVRRLLREQRERILAGAHVTFSRVFSGCSQAGPQHPLWRLAEACGAVVSSTCSDTTTHVVSLSGATEKAIWAQQHGRFLVFPSWLECSCYMWRKADEALFLV